ncbi:hypothetical protein M427DRAFT_55360 [Gonapodya prolifera JEL478]|uniref:Uncharacterized protein n=1 Tax=Gonapodya prolifera (strain JEL478) TaxID=1344416 RepID=A0A139AJS7_GONPJ|nr:hypothetical protein M427DRAFT_55360 [Gonapodya prolifera JEL478]|eukprot:KXS16733.1 hypothetical protein M427DRAFT_55360 [Gonapodya prolifera JEL478]
MTTEISDWFLRSFKDELACARLGIASFESLRNLPIELQEKVRQIHAEFEEEVDTAREWCNDAAVFLGLQGVEAEIVSYSKVIHYYVRNSRTMAERRDPALSFSNPLPLLGPEFFGGRSLTPRTKATPLEKPRPKSIFASLARNPGMDAVEGASCMIVDPDLYFYRTRSARTMEEEDTSDTLKPTNSVFLRSCPNGHPLLPVTRESYGDLRRVFGKGGGPVVMGIRQTCSDVDECGWEYKTHNVKSKMSSLL